MRRAPDSVFAYDADRAAKADRVITALVESRGLDEYWRLAYRLIAVCEGAAGDDALRLLVEEMRPASREVLARLLIEVADGSYLTRGLRDGYGIEEGPGPEASRRTAATEALAASRIDLIGRIRDGIPEREYLPGCDGWLIGGKRYLVFSPSGVGKSLGMPVVAVEVVREGGTVAIIDVENGADEYARRLESIVGDDADLAAACRERLRYYEYPALNIEWGEAEWAGALADCDLVVFDSSRHVLSTLGSPRTRTTTTRGLCRGW